MCANAFLTLALILPGRGAALPAPSPSTVPLSASPPPAAAAERLTPFDNELARVDWSSEGWRVVAGSVVLKDFGRRESEARQALRLIRELRINQHGIIGAPTPALEYWLSDGLPPRGPAAGLHTLPIDLASLRVDQRQTQWVLRDNRRELFNLGVNEDAARQALAVIQKYGFTEVGAVNPASPSMLIFLADPDALSPTDPAPHARPSAAPEKHAPDPQSPAGRLLAQHPGIDANAPIAPAMPPLRQVSLPANMAVAASSTPDRVAFDWRQVQLRKEGDGWKLASGSCVLADFGADEHAARQGLAAVQYYHFTERRQAGGAARFTYFLVGGQPPHGTMFGLDLAAQFQTKPPSGSPNKRSMVCL